MQNIQAICLNLNRQVYHEERVIETGGRLMGRNKPGVIFALILGVLLLSSIEEVKAEEGPAESYSETVQKAGWQRSNEGWYYYDEQGSQRIGWLQYNGSWYYLNGDDAEYPGRMAANCQLTINGRKYFFLDSGIMKTGWQRREGKWYYYMSSGAMAEGEWMTINGVNYYFTNSTENSAYPGSMAEDCEMRIQDKTYCFQSNGAVKTGWARKPEGWYYYTVSGARAEGEWKYIGNIWYYFLNGDENAGSPGLMAADCELSIGNKIYSFLESGAMKTGWQKKPEGWYYYTASGARAENEWKYISGIWYFLGSSYENQEYSGLMAANCELVIENKTYLFLESGAMKKGWYKRPEGWYYYLSSGEKVTGGWKNINGSWYYFIDKDENPDYSGVMCAEKKKEIGGVTYYFNASGAMRTGWLYEGGWYYLNSCGLKTMGWAYVNGKWYYMDPSAGGLMIDSGWKHFGNSWYYFRSDGSMATGWIKAGGDWYYTNQDGIMLSGWQQIGTYWYYFYKQNDPYGGPQGAMAYNKNINGFWVDSNGRWITQDLAAMNNKAQGYSSYTPYLILVNRSTHKVGIYLGAYGNWQNIMYWDCSDGAPSTPTVTGIFKVGSRGYYFDSGSARCYWYTQFYGNYLFHSVLYNKNGGIMDGRLGMALSHGCVRLQIDNAKWIYDNIPMNSTVVVY